MHGQRQRAAVLALLCGAFYFFTQGLAVLFRGGKPYLKILKHVDLDLPLYWLFELVRTLGLYQPFDIRPVYVPELERWYLLMRVRAVALGTLTYIALGYLLGFLFPVSSTPQRSEDAGDRNIRRPLSLVLVMAAAITIAGGC
jgi:hypothetical protein